MPRDCNTASDHPIGAAQAKHILTQLKEGLHNLQTSDQGINHIPTSGLSKLSNSWQKSKGY